ncbi:endonuclease/exonuclease/phosphatase family protein [Yinghuangia seranimata]|uniref:endonuclease/exonuclease/phosphatase family protein n=1 Tax=Yinghuangia seranimata TaxID=408067 RepID=UPI00248B8832|nr:endonuclease/exonuclease/phosphatase family protein [Yinghuangia seranimata]MDI2130846.1 endonuclease/exonuclease/phosphatase family protein [Yinghuangia seranimata]
MPLIGPAEPGAVHVMSFNLRGPEDPAPRGWADRRAAVEAVLEEERPTVLGTQEGRWHHIRDLAAALRPAYDWVGLGRSGGSNSEFTAVFYDFARLELLAYDHLWLSTVPKLIGSRTWGNIQHPRMLTWAAFRDRATDREFAVVNTHFDHFSPLARTRSAHLVRRLTRRKLHAKRRPVVLTGDFNAAAPEARPYRVLTEDGLFRDTWTTAAERLGPDVRTWNGWTAPEPGGRIDWILADRHWTTDAAAINTATPGGRHPSDHWPVQALLRLA